MHVPLFVPTGFASKNAQNATKRERIRLALGESSEPASYRARAQLAVLSSFAVTPAMRALLLICTWCALASATRPNIIFILSEYVRAAVSELTRGID